MSTMARMLIWSMALLLAVLPVIGVLNGWLAAQRWPIEELRVSADYRRVDELAIRDAVLPHISRGFFAVDLQQVKAAVMALDWVEQVEVRKRWPNRLELRVQEHQPFARLGDHHLVSTRGDVFALPANGAPEGLPLLDGKVERLGELLDVYRLALPLFRDNGQALVSVRLSPRGSWSFRLAEGSSVMAGRGNPLPRLQRFLPLLAELIRNDPRLLQRADLRYANGFALRWAEPQAESAENSNGRDA